MDLFGLYGMFFISFRFLCIFLGLFGAFEIHFDRLKRLFRFLGFLKLF